MDDDRRSQKTDWSAVDPKEFDTSRPDGAGSKGLGWEPDFLAALSYTANVTAASRSAGITTNTAYAKRKRSKKFAEAWRVAMREGLDRLEEALYTRGVEYSDRAAEYLLNVHRYKRNDYTRAPDEEESDPVILTWRDPE